MVESRVVSGRVIERRGHVVITVQGDLVSSYDLRYYTLPEEERTDSAEEAAQIPPRPKRPIVLPYWKRQALPPLSEPDNPKSANRA
ncbi:MULTISPECIES: hypothetical protein [Saccharibacillus]|uniref:hypothetical protein n=1 Tax=Saccharibacillus TaxID=456492 RepID=UPI00123C15C4|nr:hypothetical protein [Saccharibacillus sp. WB 17]MWJ29613.1 hypothetical protein [Saccharibacillus sp. WB 17]